MITDITEGALASVSDALESSSRYPVYLPKLPVSWSYQRFGKTLDVQGGSQPPKSQFIYEPKEGYVQLLQIRDFGERSVPTFVREGAISKRCAEDDILVARYGASLGRIVTGKAGAYNVALAKVIYDKKAFYSRYLFYLLQTQFFQTPIHMISRSAQNGFNKGDLSDILLPVAPIDEQRRIVAEIEKQFTRLEAGVAGLRRVQANFKRYRAAVLKAACEGQLVPTEAELARQESRSYETGAQLLDRMLTERHRKWNGKGKYKEPVNSETESLPKLPEGWTWATLEQVGQANRPIIYGIIKPGAHIVSGIPYVRVTEMKDGRIDIANLRRTSQERAAKFARATLAPGDVLISKDGTIGRVAVVPPELAGGNITQHVMRAPISPAIFRNYVVWAIRSDSCQRWLTGETRGVALRGVNVEDFRRLPVPVPPFPEQQRIVAEVERRLSVVEELEAVLNANLQRATRLRQSILQQGFEGKLVPQFTD